MSVLEIIAEKHLGARALRKHPHLRAALTRIGEASNEGAEKERVASMIELCFEYDRESDPEEKMSILSALEEISSNEPLELPVESVEEWGRRLKEKDAGYAKVDAVAGKRTAAFLKRYFSFRAKAGLATQAEVARKSSLSRGYVAVIESGEHVPQQKTLQKLARAFGVDVADLTP